MRHTAIPAAALLVLLTASQALASAGLPKITSLELGPHKAAIHNNSQTARIGSNTITIEITEVPVGHTVHLRFIGPDGQTLDPQLRPLQVLSGPEDAHGGHETTDGHKATGGHDMAGMPGMAGHDMTETTGHGTDTASQTFTARTDVKFPEGGTWKAVLVLEADHGDKLQAEAPFEVTYGGPNRVFVASSGIIMVGSMLYGAVQRRRKSGGR
jgi:hypothetical protein